MSKLSSITRLTAMFGVVVALAACTDAPSGPSAQPSAPLLARAKGGSGKTSTVGRATPLTQTVTVSYRIDPTRSGRIEIPAAGLEIDVPQGAVSSPVTITVSALPGNVVAYEFQPHGLVFQRPLHVRQDLRALALDRLPGKGAQSRLGKLELEIAYFVSTSDLDVAGGSASVAEFLASTFDFSGHKVEFDIEHFSGYMVSWGRR